MVKSMFFAVLVRHHTILLVTLIIVCNYMSVYVTICQYMSVYVTICQYMSVYVTICQYM